MQPHPARLDPDCLDPERDPLALAAADPDLGRVIARSGPCTLRPGRARPFPALLRAITYQQLSGRAAATIHGRLLALFPDETPTPEALLALPDEALRACGLSRAKTAAARDLALKTLDGTVPATPEALDAHSDAEIVERLVVVHGVGAWTAEMYLIFELGRPDVLPVGDLGVRAGYRAAFGGEALPTPSALRARAERWRPRRSVASWYLWRAVDLARAGTL